MRATGIVRRIDELGRVVVPKELRRTLRMKEGDPLEIFTDREGGVILKKYSPLRELTNLTVEYIESLQETIGNIILICDTDNVISVSGKTKEEYLEKKVSPDLEKVMADRKSLAFGEGVRNTVPIFEGEEFDGKYSAQIISPILAGGDVIGSVIITSIEKDKKFNEMEFKLSEIAASFLGKQI